VGGENISKINNFRIIGQGNFKANKDFKISFLLILILIFQTEDLPQFFIQQFASHPIDINTATLEELKQIPFLSFDDIEKILKYRPFKGYGEFRRTLNLSYREFLLIRPYIIILPKGFNGYFSAYGGVQFLSNVDRNLNNNTIFDSVLNRVSDYGLDVQVYYKHYAFRLRDYNLTDTTFLNNDTIINYENRFRFVFNAFLSDMAFRIGNFAPRIGYGAISYRPRYYFLYLPSFNFPSSNLSIEYRYKFLGVFIDTTRNFFIYSNYRDFYFGFIKGYYESLWSFLILTPFPKFSFSLEGSYGRDGYSYGYSLIYRDRGVFVFYNQNFYRGSQLWKYTYWSDSSFLYVYLSFFPFDLRMNMRGDRGSINILYELANYSYVILRHYRHPFFNSYQISFNQTRGIFLSGEKVKNGAILTIGYNLQIGRRYEDPYIKLRVYYFNTCMTNSNCFVNDSNLYYQPYDPDSRLNLYYWSSYEGFFPYIDSRIQLYGSGTKLSISLRYKKLYFRFIDGGRYDFGLEKNFFF